MPNIYSMTGFGKAHVAKEGLTVTVEIKSVNHRYLALNCRVPEGYGEYGPRIEAMIRGRARRGSIFYNLQITREDNRGKFHVDKDLARYYIDEIVSLEQDSKGRLAIDGAGVLALPGVIAEAASADNDSAEVIAAVNEATAKALDEMVAMRAGEGGRLAEELKRIIRSIGDFIGRIEQGCVTLVDEYIKRLTARVSALLADSEVRISEADLAREIAIYADRSDISEEIVRVRSHIEQFRETLNSEEPAGRRLEFLIQEMFREANTMGSKSISPDLSQLILALKSEVEKAKEQVLNLE